MPDVLETVDLEGVEILAAGGPIKGIGSPPEGDFYTPDDLRAMALAHTELAGEFVPPAKIGHFPRSGDPAVGHLENVRVNDDGSKLLADVKHIPRKFADLLKAKAYGSRSVELGRITSQSQKNDDGTPKVYDLAVKGLAWLGAKKPAVHGLSTLDEVLAMYEEAGVQEPDDVTAVVIYAAAGEVIWDPEAGFQDLMADVQEALNPGPGDPTYWVSDVSVDRTRALVQTYDGSGGDAWVVPIAVAADGTPTVAPSADWQPAEQAWVAAADESAKVFEARPDTRPEMPETITFTDEQRRKFSEATGLDADKVTDDMLAAAGVSETPEPPKPEPPKPEGDEQTRSLEAKVADADTRVRKLEEDLAAERKTNFVNAVLRSGKEEPGRKEHVERHYEKDPEGAIAYYATKEPDDDLAREYGADEDHQPDDAEQSERLYEAHALATFGWQKEQVA